MSHPNVRRLAAAVLALALAAAPVAAAPGPLPHAPGTPAFPALAWTSRLLDWLGFSTPGGPPPAQARKEKSTVESTTPSGTTTAKPASTGRGGLIDPNG